MASRANLPRHQYVWVDRSFMRKNGKGFEPAVWFGLHSIHSRLWGCHVMLECGAFYRDLPPHALAFSPDPTPTWEPAQAQAWECYSHDVEVLAYEYLQDLTARYDGGDETATYLFTACPVGDGFSAAPEQRKEMMFMRTAGDRLVIRPTNMVLFAERSFTEDTGWPTDIRTSTIDWRLHD